MKNGFWFVGLLIVMINPIVEAQIQIGSEPAWAFGVGALRWQFVDIREPSDTPGEDSVSGLAEGFYGEITFLNHRLLDEALVSYGLRTGGGTYGEGDGFAIPLHASVAILGRDLDFGISGGTVYAGPTALFQDATVSSRIDARADERGETPTLRRGLRWVAGARLHWFFFSVDYHWVFSNDGGGSAGVLGVGVDLSWIPLLRI